MSRVIEFRMKLTPRQREVLLTRLFVHADETYDDVEEHGDTAVGSPECWWNILDQLPSYTWELPVSWRRGVARAFDDLAGDLERGVLPRPRSVAEGLALALSLDVARQLMADRAYGPEVEDLPAYPADDDWDAVEGELLGDGALGVFFAADAAELAACLGSAPPESWFVTLPDAAPRDPQRGYRR